MVYAIASGEYSDWQLHGYFTDPKLAFAYCFKENPARREDCMYEYYVTTLQEIKIDSSKTPEFYYQYKFSCFESVDSRQWYFHLDDDDVKAVNDFGKTHVDLFGSNGPGYRHALTYVFLNRYDVAAAEKIAQDTLYKYLAEKCIDPQPDDGDTK